MAWAFVQATAVASGSGSATTVALAYTSNVVAAHLLVAYVTYQDTAQTVTATCADSLGQTWSAAIGPTRNSGLGGGWTQYIFYFANTVAGADTVTVTFSASVAFRRLDILEYSGIATTTPLDVTSGAIGSGASTKSSGSATTTQNNDLIFGGGITDAGDIAAGATFTSRASSDSFERSEDKNGAVAGSFDANFTGANAQWIVQMATFKEPSVKSKPRLQPRWRFVRRR